MHHDVAEIQQDPLAFIGTLLAERSPVVGIPGDVDDLVGQRPDLAVGRSRSNNEYFGDLQNVSDVEYRDI